MNPLKITSLHQTARPRSARLRELPAAATVRSSAWGAVSLAGYATAADLADLDARLTARADQIAKALEGYLPLTGGTLTGPVQWTDTGHSRTTYIGAGTVQLRGDWASVSLINSAGDRVTISAHSAGNRLNFDLFPAGAAQANTNLTLNGGTWHAYTALSLADTAVIRQGDATLRYDAARGAWISDKPIVSRGDITAFSS